MLQNISEELLENEEKSTAIIHQHYTTALETFVDALYK